MTTVDEGTILIHSDGTPVNARSHWITEGWTQTTPLESYIDYACRNMGYIAISRSRHATTVMLRPGIASDIAEASMYYQLAGTGHGSGRYRLRVFTNEWLDLIAPNFNGLIQAINQHQRSARTPDNYLHRPVTVEELAPNNGLVQAVNYWRSGALDLSALETSNIDLTRFCDRYLVLRKRPNRDLYFEGIGQGYSVWGDVSVSALKGKSFTTTLNQSYISRAAQAYHCAIEHNGPAIEQVDALAYKKNNELERLTYWRAAFPQHLQNGDTLLLTLSVDDPTIDLRNFAAA